MKLSTTLIFLFVSFFCNGTHIAGGEFQVRHLKGFSYSIQLILYFDKIHGTPGSLDQSINARIFRYNDNAKVMDVPLPLLSSSSLNYSNLTCLVNDYQFDNLTYGTTIEMLPANFSDPNGYYIVWERCCRNVNVTNFAGAPAPQLSEGQTFYLKFPPVLKSIGGFTNSSPILLRPLQDYACVGRNFHIGFNGLDADGDSLVYSMTTPWATHSFDGIPPEGPRPGPYPEIKWQANFSSEHVFGGNSKAKIDSKGLFTVIPPQAGLFGYAIKCEEYRDGILIGEVRREFQLLVLDCHDQSGPSIVARNFGGTYSDQSITVTIDNSTSDENKGFQVKVTDEDAIQNPESIRIRAIPIGFSKSLSHMLPSITTSRLSSENQFAEFSLYFLEKCPPDGLVSFQIGIIAYDESCAIPQTDTIRVNINMSVPDGECLQQTIHFPPIPDKLITDDSFSLEAGATSGLPIDFSPSLNISTDGSILYLLSEGLATITASQNGNTTYLPAKEVRRQFCINPLPPNLSIEPVGTSLVVKTDVTDFQTLWYVDGILQLSVNPVLPITDLSLTHEYKAKTSVEGCISDFSQPLVLTSAQEDLLQVFPNPFNDFLHVVFPRSGGANRLRLIDQTGKLIFEHRSFEPDANIESGKMQAGLYLAIIETDGFVAIKKLYKN